MKCDQAAWYVSRFVTADTFKLDSNIKKDVAIFACQLIKNWPPYKIFFAERAINGQLMAAFWKKPGKLTTSLPRGPIFQLTIGIERIFFGTKEDFPLLGGTEKVRKLGEVHT